MMDTPDWESGVPLNRLMELHSARGHRLPLAVAHSVALDLLQAVDLQLSGGPLNPAEVVVEPTGVARTEGPSSFQGLLPLLVSMFGADRPDGLPPHARSLLGLFDDLASGAGAPGDPERLRWALSDELPPPANHLEVAALARELVLPVPEPMDNDSDLPTLPPISSSPRIPRQQVRASAESFSAEPEAPVHPLVGARSAGAYDHPPSSAERSVASAAGALLAEVASEGSTRSEASRPVVRHEIPRSDPPVSLSRAPAARRSARAGIHGNDSILGPGEDRGWLMWVVVIGALAGAMYLLFFG